MIGLHHPTINSEHGNESQKASLEIPISCSQRADCSEKIGPGVHRKDDKTAKEIEGTGQAGLLGKRRSSGREAMGPEN